MAFRTGLAKQTALEADNFSVVLANYLGALSARSFKELEDRTVNELLSAWRTSVNGRTKLPVTLSAFIDKFQICPRPLVVQGQQDGEIAFDYSAGQFLIRLYSVSPRMPLKTLAQLHPRMRFTYAHEVAHRFCYVLRDGEWKRAQEVATADLDHATQLKHRITLSGREEGFCNSVARRILIPAEFIQSICTIEEWFARGPGFFSALSDSARQFGVSRHCLLVRLQRELELKSPHFVMILGLSVGPVTQRGRRTLRLLCGIMPEVNGRERSKWYPGLDVSKFGEPFFRVISDLLLSGQSRREGAITTELRLGTERPMRLDGWFRLLRGDADGGDDRVMLWGRAQ